MKFDIYKKKTFTTSWNHFNTKPKANNSVSNLFKKLKKILKKYLNFNLSIKIKSNKKVKDETFISYQTNEEIIKYRNILLKEKIIDYLNLFEIKFLEKDVNKYIEEYCIVFSKSKVTELGSGFGFNEGLFLFCILKVIKPTIVIESGIMKGFTSYIIDASIDINCSFFCYDINFDNIEFKSNKAKYYNSDITENIPNLKGERVFAFWDDHISQLDRLNFSLKHNIKFNVFDDDLGFLTFHSDGWPPIPSITMLKEIKQQTIKSDQVEWICRGRKGEINLKNIDMAKSYEKINHHRIFPNLFDITGYKSHSQCSFVIIK